MCCMLDMLFIILQSLQASLFSFRGAGKRADSLKWIVKSCVSVLVRLGGASAVGQLAVIRPSICVGAVERCRTVERFELSQAYRITVIV